MCIFYTLYFILCFHICMLDWQKFLQTDILEEELSLETPTYVVTEGHEPPFFTCFFEWDPSKANVSGSSALVKLSTLRSFQMILMYFHRLAQPYFYLLCYDCFLINFSFDPDAKSLMTGDDTVALVTQYCKMGKITFID